jgi:hypothetical protein
MIVEKATILGFEVDRLVEIPQQPQSCHHLIANRLSLVPSRREHLEG